MIVISSSLLLTISDIPAKIDACPPAASDDRPAVTLKSPPPMLAPDPTVMATSPPEAISSCFR